MKQEELLRAIAEAGYNIGFGAKKHFATYDIIEKAPNWIGFISFAIGVFGLIYNPLSTKIVSAALTVLGVSGLYVALYASHSENYAKAGKDLTRCFDRLKLLYYTTKDASEDTVAINLKELEEIQDSAREIGVTKQIFPSDWYAHYKFFWQHQIDWIDEQKNFRLFRDKIPLSLSALIALILVGVAWILARGSLCSIACP
ncbi:MAG: SLATT domain-containing protein [Candidatus Thiodiazotropha endolucinida]